MTNWTPEQKRFLLKVAQWTPRLIASVLDGNHAAEISLGSRRDNGRHIMLYLRAQVHQDETSPMKTHGTKATTKKARSNTQHKNSRRRKRKEYFKQS